MELTVGTIITGKVTSITKFGAFVALPDGKSGLVHISEVAGTFVSDVHDFLTEGQEVPVKVLSVSPEGKISLSVKQAQPPKPRPPHLLRHILILKCSRVKIAMAFIRAPVIQYDAIPLKCNIAVCCLLYTSRCV